MLSIDRNHLLRLSEAQRKKQRTPLRVLAFLLLVGGILCLINPFASGAILSVALGAVFLLGGIGLVVSMIANRVQNTLPMIGGILLGIAYALIGYLFISNPLSGILALAIYLGVLFAFGGIARLIGAFTRRGETGNLWQFVIGVLDLIIAWTLVASGPAASVSMLTAIVGIEMLVSAFALFQISSLLKAVH